MWQKLQNEMECVIKAAGENKFVMESWKWTENCDENCPWNAISQGYEMQSAMGEGIEMKYMCD